MPSTDPTTRFIDPALREQVRRLRTLDNATNLAHLAREYACITIVVGGSIAWAEFRAARGLGWAWDLPILGLAIVLMGGLQHRLAGLGHEASHYTLLTNKFWNDLIGDLFCMLPLLTNVQLYRAFHMAHHRYTNDPDRDPEMVHMGRSKRIEEFPMPPRRFVRNFYLAPLVSPWPLVRYGWAYIDLTVLGRGGTGHRGRMADGPVIDHGLRPATALGLLYLAGAIGLQWHLVGREFLWSAAEGLLGVALVAVVAYGLPAGTHPRSPARQPYSGRLAGVLRLGYYTTLLVILGRLHDVTGGRSTVYFVLLWILPFATTFLYFMWLRDVYQHANADDGRLTNSRIFRCDPFTRWAVFVYGQDLHVTHHLFPGIPHHRLAELHDLLTREHAGYATRVVECHGTFANRRGLPTILDVLAGAPNPARAAPSPGAETAEAGPAAS